MAALAIPICIAAFLGAVVCQITWVQTCSWIVVIGCMFITLRYTSWPCPRCHQWFHGVLQSITIYFASQCKQCGLPVDDPDPSNWIPK